jgi:haloacid dehalogenase-like hydrolase
VQATIDRSSRTFVPPESRIATFDQDGTLWVEHPMYTQVMYCLERVSTAVKEKPQLRERQPFKTILSGDREAIAKLSLHELEEVLFATLTGMTVEQFNAEAKTWIQSAKHPRWDKLYTDLTYQPMQEVLRYLRQWLQDLHCDRRRPGFRAGVLRAGVWHPARADRWHGWRHYVRLRQGRQPDAD